MRIAQVYDLGQEKFFVDDVEVKNLINLVDDKCVIAC